jgi:hypothetical protein
MAVLDNRVRSHAMPHGKFADITVLKVTHALVPVAAAQAAKIGPRHQRLFTSHFKLRLKRKRLVTGVIGSGTAVVDQEDRNGSSADRQPTLSAVAVDRPHGKHQPQPRASAH